MDLTYLSQIAMQVISYGGMAKSEYLKALTEFKKKNMEAGNQYLDKGDKYALEAHKIHAQVLNKEMSEATPQISLLLTHAEDQLMSAEIIRLLVNEVSELYSNKKGD